MFTSARLLLCFLFPLSLVAQIVEDFSDGDFLNNPAWEGDTNLFVVNEGFELQSNGPDTASGVLHLSTPNTRLNSTEWRLRVRYPFPPSGSNRVRVYLASDVANLEGELNGYFLEMGETGAEDPINFFRQTGTEVTLIGSGTAGTVGSGINVHLRILRDELGNWDLYADPTGEDNFVFQGSVLDDTHTSTAYFGWQINHTSSRSQSFLLDDIFIGDPTLVEEPPADTTAPLLQSVGILSPNQLEVLFSESIDPQSLNPLSNFTVNQGVGSPFSADLDIQDSSRIRLNFIQGFVNNVDYTLSISEVRDVAGNAIADTSISFSLGSSEIAAVGEVIINEILPDPTPSIGLPGVEYLELLNLSDKEFNLQDWTLDNGTTVGTLPAYALGPGEFVVLSSTDADSVWGTNNAVIAVRPWTNLVNGGDELVLRSVEGVSIDSVFYSLSWYGDPDRDGGGYALERITTEPITCPPITNWAASNDTSGGTPGTVNSLFSTSGDTLAPILVSVEILTQDTLLLCFSESMDLGALTNTGNYQLNTSITITSAQAFDTDAICVVLGLSDTLARGNTYEIQASNMADCSGNAPLADLTGEIFLSFDPQPGDIIFHELMIDPIPSVGLPETEYIELYNASGSTYNLGGWIVSNGSRNPSLDTYVLGPGEYVVLVETGDEVLFPDLANVLAVSPWPTLSNSGGTLELKTDILANPIDSVSYTSEWYQNGVKANGGYSLERIDAGPSSCPPFSNWIAAEADTGGTPGVANSASFLSSETAPPRLESVSILSADTLLFCFNESMDPLLLADPGNYGIDGGITLLEAQVGDRDQTCARVALSEGLIPGTIYTVSVEEVSDCRGNVLEGRVERELLVSRTPETADIIINEIFADPTPQVGLPTVEYIELFNRSDNAYFLQGWTLSNGSTISSFPAQILEAGAYAIAVAVADTAAYSGLGQVLPMLSWPSLVAGGDNLGIRTATGTLMDTVDYDISWYRDEEKDNGGYSLERIDLMDNACLPSTNWIASEDESGGTPGIANSVLRDSPDETPPSLLEVGVIASDTIRLCFSESVSIASASDISNYQVNGQALVSQIFPQGPDFSCYKLVVAESLIRGIEYTLEVSRISDCYGNIMGSSQSLLFSLGETAEPFEVVFTEIFADPDPPVGLPEVEYVEIFNRSAKIIDISNWGIQDPRVTATWAEAILQPGEYAILTRSQNQGLFQSFGKVIAVDRFPDLGNAGDSLYLLNELGIQVDYVFYDRSWYENEVKDDGGFSLEKIDPDFTDCNNPGNWSASTAEVGGTPGTENSIKGTFQDTLPPTISGIRILDPNTVEVFFSEQMDPETLQIGNNYSISPSIGAPLLGFPASPGYTSVQLLFEADLDSSILYTLTYTNLSDCGGNPIEGFINFGFPESISNGDILLNEILFNPLTGGGDYVEIKNVSEKVLDLQDLFLGEMDPDTREFTNVKKVADQTVLILPGELLCLTSEVSFQQATYLPPDTAKFFQMESFPSYADNEGIAVLFTQSDTLEIFEYLDDFHFPTLADDDGVSLERISLDAPIQDPGNWQSASATVNYGTPGYANSQAVTIEEPESQVELEETTFTPNGDGIKDVLTITYDFDFIGINARVSIFDVNGRLVKTLQNNILLDPGPGSFFWDGRNEDNQKALIGPYVVLFEVVNQQTGEKEVFKRVAVLADNF